MMNKNEKSIAYMALGAVCFFWGTTYFGIRIAVRDLPPFFLSGFRHIISGGLICGYLMVFRGYKIPPLKELRKIFIMGFLFIFLSNAMLNWAEIYISSGLAALLCTFVPWYILLFNIVLRNSEPINLYSGLGLVIGLLGLVTIFYDSLADVTNAANLPGIIFTMVANVAWATGTIYVKKADIKTHPVFSSGLQMVMVGVFIMMVSGLYGEYENVRFTNDSILAVAYLIVFGSLVGYNSYIYAVSKLPTTVVSIYAYINPIVAIVLGWLFLEEKITLTIVVAMALTLFGVFLINWGYRKARLVKVVKNE